MFPPATDCWYLSGPTASGKTQVAIEVAQLVGAEIISLDSMAIYRDMDIGTAKPAAELRMRVPHHLIDIIDPDRSFSLADYVAAAHQAIAAIRGRGREVLFVGGTPLYLKSMLRGLLEGPPGDAEFRRQVQDELRHLGGQALRERLQQVDPLSAAKLHPHDTRRMIRALEVYKLTGAPISHLQLQFDQGHPADQCKVFVVTWPRPRLHERINARVNGMFAAGIVAEVRELLARHGQISSTAIQAVGYREVVAHLRGEYGLEETIERTKARTRRFARRQETWFRSLSECRWIIRTDDCPPDVLARRLFEWGDTRPRDAAEPCM
jgi:tRNA dimethylallyltransferase